MEYQKIPKIPGDPVTEQKQDQSKDYTYQKHQQKKSGRAAGKREGDSLIDKTHPFTQALLMGAAAIVCAGLVIFQNADFSSTRVQTGTNTANSGASVSPTNETLPLCEVFAAPQVVSWYMEDDNLVYTVRIDKLNEHAEAFGGGYDVKVYSKYADDDSWIYIPYSGMFTDSIYVSDIIFGFSSIEPDSVDFEFIEDGTAEVYYPSWYSYLVKKDNPDQEAILEAYQIAHSSEFPEIEIISAQQDGTVVFESVFETDESLLVGEYNILFKKDGTVVYADTGFLEDPENDLTVVNTYKSFGNVPDFDEVEIVVLH